MHLARPVITADRICRCRVQLQLRHPTRIVFATMRLSVQRLVIKWCGMTYRVFGLGTYGMYVIESSEVLVIGHALPFLSAACSIRYAHTRIEKYRSQCSCAFISHDTIFEHPLNLSILLSGGGIAKQDIFSHCEWTRAVSSSKLYSHGQCVAHMLHQPNCRSNTFAILAREGDRPFFGLPYIQLRHALHESYSFGFECKWVVQLISTWIHVRIR